MIDFEGITNIFGNCDPLHGTLRAPSVGRMKIWKHRDRRAGGILGPPGSVHVGGPCKDKRALPIALHICPEQVGRRRGLSARLPGFVLSHNKPEWAHDLEHAVGARRGRFSE